MREQVDRQRIELFLRHLGRRFSQPGRIYLVGGTTMVFEGLREQTLDIDISIDIPDAYHSEFIAIVRKLKDELSINVEEASPADFIPVPSGYQERSQFIGRYGQLDVFHYDLYSTALSKVERGTESDFADVLSLLKERRLEMATLKQFFDEIMSRYATHSLKQDPKEFRLKFQVLEEMWRISE